MKPYSDSLLVEETRSNGWIFGAITAYLDVEGGCAEGDGFVETPNGEQIFVAWEVGAKRRVERRELSTDDQLGVIEVSFEKRISSSDDLAREFAAVLSGVQKACMEFKMGKLCLQLTNRSLEAAKFQRAFSSLFVDYANRFHDIDPLLERFKNSVNRLDEDLWMTSPEHLSAFELSEQAIVLLRECFGCEDPYL